jgi:hypothetical protein
MTNPDSIAEAQEALEDALLSFEEVALQGLDTAEAWTEVMAAADRLALAAFDYGAGATDDNIHYRRARLEGGSHAD